jgi:hypothetical protein
MASEAVVRSDVLWKPGVSGGRSRRQGFGEIRLPREEVGSMNRQNWMEWNAVWKRVPQGYLLHPGVTSEEAVDGCIDVKVVDERLHIVYEVFVVWSEHAQWAAASSVELRKVIAEGSYLLHRAKSIITQTPPSSFFFPSTS